MGILGLLKTIGIVSIIVLMAVGAFQVYGTSKDVINESFAERPAGTAKDLLLVGAAIDLTSPAWQKEWIGSPDKKTFLLEDLPWPDSRELWFLFLPYWVFIATPLFRKLNENANGFLETVGWVLVAYILGAVVVWILWKAFLYWLMINRAASIGISSEEILAIRQSFMARMDSVPGYHEFVGLSIIGGLAAFLSKLGDKE